MKFKALNIVQVIIAIIMISFAAWMVGVSKSVTAIIDLLIFGIYVAGWLFPTDSHGYVHVLE